MTQASGTIVETDLNTTPLRDGKSVRTEYQSQHRQIILGYMHGDWRTLVFIETS